MNDEATCEGCGETAACEPDAEVPEGWWSINAIYGRDDGEEQKRKVSICSPDCAKQWLEAWEEE